METSLFTSPTLLASCARNIGSVSMLQVSNLTSFKNYVLPLKYQTSSPRPTFKRLVVCASNNDLLEKTSCLPEEIELAKSDLIEAISLVGGRGKDVSKKVQKDIADAICALEYCGGIPNPAESELIEGKWKLMYTTRPGTASPIQRTFVGVDSFSVFQDIKLTQTNDPRVSNIVSFSETIGELNVEAKATVNSGKRIKFQFDRAAFYFKFLPFTIPYPVPFRLLGDKAKGWLDTTFLSPSGDLRISRGNKGTIFVLQKEFGPRQKLLLAIKSKKDVIQAIEELSKFNPTPSPAQSPTLSGKWKLIWTSQSSNASPLQKFSVSISDNWQIIDGEKDYLENYVQFIPGFNLRAFATTRTSDTRTQVIINSACIEIGSLSIPLKISGQGYVEQMYLDERLRISRGDRGSVFVHIRD